MEKNRNDADCCSCSSGCCGGISEISNAKKQITIDFLYLDLSVCTRCQGTDTNLDEALNEVARVLEATGTEVLVNKINVNTVELAETYKFVSSPTIRVNGRDIQLEVKESLCESCGDLCGADVDCRVWIYQGQEYTTPPKAMIIEAILKEVYGGKRDVNLTRQEYVMPDNLKNFYAVIKSQKQKVSNQT
jgi:O-phosphoseryl-tRNA(Cys) synthetase